MKAEIIVNRNFEIGKIDRRIYGSFIEHIGRAVYHGIYEPNHPSANEQGFRTDVLELTKQLRVPIVRYPGGNFVSGYRWEDGTGDKSKRPVRRDLAWNSIETNEIGIDEFQQWAKLADTEIMMAVNLGTRGAQDAANLVEYCNSDDPTYYADMRRHNGFEKPFGIKTWCLGNEMDGPWQIEHKTAEEYGRIACESAKLMKRVDPSIELIACGSSYYDMPTFGTWEMTVLEHTYEQIDYLSLHQYCGKQNGSTPDFLGRSVQLDLYIKTVAAICDVVKAKKRTRKRVDLSLDEWNVWYHTKPTRPAKAQIATPIVEDIYTFEDALVAGCMMIALHNNCDRVKMACLAQLVNVIAPIMTENKGGVWLQTIFYPYLYASLNGHGTTLRQIVKCASYTTSYNLDVPYIEASVIHNKEKREIVMFAVNRSTDEDMALSLELEGFDSAVQTEHIMLYHDDLNIVNGMNSSPVQPISLTVPSCTGRHQTLSLKKHSWNMIKFAY